MIYLHIRQPAQHITNPCCFLCRLVAHHSGSSRSSSAFAYSIGCCLHPEKVSIFVAARNPGPAMYI